MNKKVVISIVIAGVLIWGATYATRFETPEAWRAWKTYEDKSVGISFKYPAYLVKATLAGNLVLLSSHENDTYQAIKIDRSFGFGLEKTSENAFNTIWLNNKPVIEKIKIDGKDAILADPYHSTEKAIYVLVDDALFTITLYGVEPEKFYKNFSFNSAQILSDFSTENISTSTKRFTNLKYHYQINIPTDFGYVSRGSDIFFRAPFEGPGPGIAVYASTTSFLDSSAVIVAPTSKGVFEKEIIIGGIKAAVTHVGSKETEEFREYKNVQFEENGIYFNINTQYVDHEAVWKSFKFTGE